MNNLAKTYLKRAKQRAKSNLINGQMKAYFDDLLIMDYYNNLIETS